VTASTLQVAVSNKNTRENRMSRKVFVFVWLLLAVFLPAVLAGAQQAKKVPRIGYLSTNGTPSRPPPFVEAFRQGLRELGYVEGKNILVEYRYAEGKLERVPGLVTELVQLNVEALVVGTQTAIRAAKQATKTIPIIMVNNSDPVATGLVESLAHPGGNITGLSTLGRGLGGKRLELLKEVVPEIGRVGVLWHAEGATAALALKEYQAAAPALKIQLQSLELRSASPDLDGAFKAAAEGRVNALITDRAPVFNRYAKRIADLAIKNRLPSMYAGSEYVQAGGLVSYATNTADQYRRAASYVDSILKGAKPANLPVEQPTKFELVINLKTAKQIALTITPNILARPDKVIK
jgi:putative tryptophan/tyrosine transport system substrate-binding protein